MKDLVKQLVEAYGPSGHEAEVRALISERIRPFVTDVRTDSMGNLIALKKGQGDGKRVMVSAHMDEIGVMVTFVDKKGYLRFAPLSGSPLTMVGGRVRFANGVVGTIGWEKWFQSDSHTPAMEELYIDVGASSPESSPIKVGDAGCFDRAYVDLGQRLTSKAMDDRIGCAVAIQALKELGQTPNDVYAVFSTQEELGCRGAMVAAFGVEPEVGLAVDVTLTGDTPEARKMAVELGGGPAIKIMDGYVVTNPSVKDWMIGTAERLKIAHQREVMPFGGTDASAIQRSRAGVPSGCLSVPCRYIHTPSEMVDYGDVLASVRLLVGLLKEPIAI